MGDVDSHVYVQLTGDLCAKAYIAARKEGHDAETATMEAIGQFVGDQAAFKDEQRVEVDPREASEIARLAQEHGQHRREKGHSGAQKKYYAAGMRMQDQLIRQGEWYP